MSNRFAPEGPARYRFLNRQYVPAPGRENATAAWITRRYRALAVWSIVVGFAAVTAAVSAIISDDVFSVAAWVGAIGLGVGALGIFAGLTVALDLSGLEKLDAIPVLSDSWFIDWHTATLPAIHAGMKLIIEAAELDATPLVNIPEDHLGPDAAVLRGEAIARIIELRRRAAALFDGSTPLEEDANPDGPAFRDEARP